MSIKTLVLYSGGLDSSVVLAEALKKEKVVALIFNYGQTNQKEIKYAKKLSKIWGFDLAVRHLIGVDGNANYEIPARNTLFLAYALQYAIENDIKTVLFGAEPDSTYVDSSIPYIKAQKKLFKLHGIKLKTPVKGYADKKEILLKSFDLGLPFNLIHSCRNSDPCFKCRTCMRVVKSIMDMFPHRTEAQVIKLIKLLKKKNTYGKDNDIRNGFKYIPALFEIMNYKSDSLSVYTTGNWGKALIKANKDLGLNIQIEVINTGDVDLLRKNYINTNTFWGKKGTRMGLSSLKRPIYNSNTYEVTVVQGNLLAEFKALGFKVGDGKRLITK